MSLLRKLLFPLSLLFKFIQEVRNLLYDLNIIANTKFNIPTISVGNLSMGGTGKTPMVEYLLSNLLIKYKIGILSRGYKRKSNGFLKLNEYSDISVVGDEPFIIQKTFPDSNVYVCEDRVTGIKNILKNDELDFIILDDAFQHRKLKTTLNIMLSSFSKPFYNDYIFPVGDLRESRLSYKRANIIIITKCPANLNQNEMNDIKLKINPLEDQKIFFTTILYKDILFGNKSLNINSIINKEILLVTGIAETDSIIRYLNSRSIKFKHLEYSDHHHYSNNDINNILKLSRNSLVLTTKKDYYKLKDNINNLLYLDIETRFLKNEDQFLKEVYKILN
ncbi:MAG: tetraacyldisaccharide 4'-kinase [Flavobacteriaceae bacterium]|nr:tetraacyldisaccharide 4'-kinase [Flavobacteriaceae bacterium]